MDEPCTYCVCGCLVLHNGISIRTGRPVDALTLQVDEVARVLHWEDAPRAVAMTMRRRHSRGLSDWDGRPVVWEYVEPSEEPPDRVMRSLGAPMLPGMD